MVYKMTPRPFFRMLYNHATGQLLPWVDFINGDVDLRKQFARETQEGTHEAILVTGHSDRDISAAQRLAESGWRAMVGHTNEARKIVIPEEYFDEAPVHGHGGIVKPTETA